MKLFKRQQGDTIVEVLIAVSVLSLILVISLAATNRNTMGVRQSQERGEASEQTEAQIELFKAYLSSSSNPVMPADGSRFCMRSDGTDFIVVTGTTIADFEANADLRTNCKKNDLYYIFVERSGNTYTTITRWDKVAGAGQDEARMVHRLYPDIAATGGGVAVSQNCPVNYYIETDGNCKPCRIGYTSPGGYTFACAPIPAIISVAVDSIPFTTSPGPHNGTNEWQPSCGDAGQTTNGTFDVMLDGEGGPFSGRATLTSVVVHGRSYTSSITIPNGWELCDVTPAGGNIDSAPLGTPSPQNLKNIKYRVRPVCGPKTFETESYEHFGPAYEHFAPAQHHFSQAWWYHHDGTDGRRQYWGAHDHYIGEWRTLYNGVHSFTGYFTVWYKYRSDLGLTSTGNKPFFEVWTWRPDYYGYYQHSLGTYADSLGWYRDQYTLNKCSEQPSASREPSNRGGSDDGRPIRNNNNNNNLPTADS